MSVSPEWFVTSDESKMQIWDLDRSEERREGEAVVVHVVQGGGRL